MEKGKLIINGVEVGGSSGSATSISYDNTNSGLEATNVQGAIDELNSNLQYSNLNMRYNATTDKIEVLYNGVWKEWVFAGVQTCYLYNRGDEINLLTGGWISDGYTMSTDKTTSGVLNEASMSINGPGSNGNSQILGTYNPIDVTNYTKIKIHVLNANLYSSVGGYLILATTKQLNTDICIEINSKSENTYILDITDLSGEYYIACVARGTATRGFVADKIWLE